MHFALLSGSSSASLGCRYRFRDRDVVVCGKKRMKRKPPPKVHKANQLKGSVSDYLMFGDALGLSVEESLERLKNNPATEHMTTDPEAQKLIKK